MAGVEMEYNERTRTARFVDGERRYFTLRNVSRKQAELFAPGLIPLLAAGASGCCLVFPEGFPDGDVPPRLA